VYLVVASIFSLSLFSPLRVDLAGPGVGLVPKQLKVVAVLATAFTVLGAMAPFCHGASLHFAKAVRAQQFTGIGRSRISSGSSSTNSWTDLKRGMLTQTGMSEKHDIFLRALRFFPRKAKKV
jgi:hypothetical protein